MVENRVPIINVDQKKKLKMLKEYNILSIYLKLMIIIALLHLDTYCNIVGKYITNI